MLFALIAIFLFTGAFLESFNFFFIGMMLYPIFSLVFVRREYWKEIRIRKPVHPIYILWGIILGILIILANYLITYLTNFNPLNSMVVEARLQLSYMGITKYNAWQYFPASALGFCILSPLTEELFFRGFLLKSFENRFSAIFASMIAYSLGNFLDLLIVFAFIIPAIA